MPMMIAMLSLACMINAARLQMRYLQEGIAYLRHGRIVVDRAMPMQAMTTLVVSTGVIWVLLDTDPIMVSGPFGLALVPLGVAGAMSAALLLICMMALQDMRIDIDHDQTMFLRDRTPGVRSRRRVAVRPHQMQTSRGVRHER